MARVRGADNAVTSPNPHQEHHHLSYGLSIILGFIGVKLVLHVQHALHVSRVHVPETSIPLSLGFIVLVLTVTTLTSLRASKKQELQAAPRRGAGPS